MFTINIYLRLALIAVLTIGGVILSAAIHFWYGFPFWLTGLFLLVGYILLGTVQSAAQFMQSMDFIKAEQRLGMTLNYKWLLGPNRAYYYIIKGTIALNTKKQDEAEMWLNKANDMALQSDDERGMVLLQLANLSATKGKWNNAQIHFRTAKKLKITDPNLREQLKQFEKALSNRGQMKHMRQGGKKGGLAGGMSGKRRRPKMK
jgi:tetratricopeptide (TPR) repeat protein